MRKIIDYDKSISYNSIVESTLSFVSTMLEIDPGSRTERE